MAGPLVSGLYLGKSKPELLVAKLVGAKIKAKESGVYSHSTENGHLT